MKFVQPIKNIDDINNIKKYFKTTSLRNYLLFLIGINTSMKTSVVLHLKFNDILDDNNMIKSTITIDEKIYKVTDTMKEAIEQYIQDRRFCSDDYIFKSNKSNDPINRSHLYRILNNAALECNISISIGNETLRKTYGYHYYYKTRDLKYLQNAFNKSSQTKLYRYLDIDENDEVKSEFCL